MGKENDYKDILQDGVSKRFVSIMDAENITSLTAFAQMLNVYVQRLHNIVHGRTLPAMDILARVCDLLPDLSMEWLITGKGNMYKNNIIVVNGRKKKMSDARQNPEANAELFDQIAEKDKQIEKLIDAVYGLSKEVEKAGLRRNSQVLT